MTKKVKFSIFLLSVSLIFIYVVGRWAFKAKDELLYPRPVMTVQSIEENLETILTDFESILKENNPAVYNTLNQGLSIGEIGELETTYKIKLPEEVKTLYMWHNGCSNFEDAFQNGTIIPGHWFMPLEESLKMTQSLRRPEGTIVQKILLEAMTGYRKEWIMLLHDGCGDGYYCDPARTSDSGYVFYNFTEISHYIFFPSLKNMFQAFIECYQNNIFKDEMDVNDYEASDQIMAKYGIIVN
ncbi:MAG: SMI1/KNR4 family protein [Phycisphaerae bacterium]|nr:SMI1/KNR4 family protein [Phycisphaerae bacterium]